MARGRGTVPPAGRPPHRPGRAALPRTRSRSPRMVPAASVPLRRDAPSRLQHSVGTLPDLSTEASREAALADFVLDIYAPSNRASVASRLRLCERILAIWNLPTLPPSGRTISALGASLKAGRYRSASVYLSTYKSWTARHGHDWSAVLQQAFQDAVRSCERGLGGPVKARALPFGRLGELPGGDAPWTAGGPMRPRSALVLGAWFLTREIELSSASAAALELSFPRPGIPQVRFHLPASKTDITAVGTAREHGCSCHGAPSAACPAHAAWDHLSFLRDHLPDRWQSAAAPLDLPLFPAASGAACSKEAMCATILHAATSRPTVRRGSRVTHSVPPAPRASPRPASTRGPLSCWAGGGATRSGATLGRLGRQTPRPWPGGWPWRSHWRH